MLGNPSFLRPTVFNGLRKKIVGIIFCIVHGFIVDESVFVFLSMKPIFLLYDGSHPVFYWRKIFIFCHCTFQNKGMIFKNRIEILFILYTNIGNKV